MKTLILFITLILTCSYCATAQKTTATGPHAIVYKTKKDYRKLVPVVLSADKSKIVSYPDPHDLKAAGTRLQPTALHKGYYLDNNGISANTAFIKMTYAEYANLKQTPSLDELYKMVIDKNPLTTLYDCGAKSAYKKPATQINQLIDNKKLVKKCASLLNSK